MSGKRFYSPAASGPGYSQLYRSSGSRPRAGGEHRAATERAHPSSQSPHAGRPGRVVPQTSSAGLRQVSPSYLRGSVSPGGRSRQPGPLLSQSATPHGNISGGTATLTSPSDVHHLLNDLVEISEAIASYISQDPSVRLEGTSSSSVSPQQQAMLKAQEIERIVKRVESHFLAKMNALQNANHVLERQVQTLKTKLAAFGGDSVTAQQPLPSDRVVPEVREGIRQQGEALDELGKEWESLRGDNEQVDQLRRILVAEKRQRLLVEEQTQMLTEQHAKVVTTLERRLRKQEDQLRDLINALDRNSHVSTASPSLSISGSPENSTNAARGVTTPRHLLRQQLAQHQQTQRALQEYQQHLANATLPAAMSENADDLGLEQVQRTLDSIKSSQPLTFAATPSVPSGADAARTDVIVTGDLTPANPTNRSAAARGAPQTDVDEISAFLDNITKELETISGTD